MDNKEFLDKVDRVLPSVTSEQKEKLWKRILFEIDNAKQNPDMYEDTLQLREKIIDIETRAINKLRKVKIVLKKEGKKCSFCPRHKSDVSHFIRIDETWNVCSNCISLIMEIVNEK